MSLQAKKELHEGVRKAYSEAAEHPGQEHPFPVGRQFAESLGYPKALLDTLPSACVEAFAGVSNIAISANIPKGATVLDLGCGAGLDTLIAAGKVGSEGQVIGVDFSEAMLTRVHRSARKAGYENIALHHTDAGYLSLDDGAVDVALINGIFNLNPNREAIFQELARVVRKNGEVYVAELILRESLPDEEKDETNWFA